MVQSHGRSFTIGPRDGLAFSIIVIRSNGGLPSVHIVADGVHGVDQAVVFERAMFKAVELMSRPLELLERPTMGHETRRKDER